jgi:hypothetical protein
MGGEREFMAHQSTQLSRSPVLLGGLRIHESRGEVHFHDDNANPCRKVAVPVAVWSKAAEKFLSEPAEWAYFDGNNSSQLLVKSGINNGVFDVELCIQPANVGDTFQKLQAFTQG